MSRNRIDLVRPDAPALAAPGPHPVGVRTLSLGLADQPDIASGAASGHSRVLTAEAWYPAPPGTAQGGCYDTVLRDGVRRAVLSGRARRDAPCAQGIRAPLVVLSHGYPGNRYLMCHLVESLAGRGFVVVAPDHAGSTYDDLQDFGATLLHRPLDQRGVIDAMAALAGDLGALVDCARVGVIGFSMGGYGALVLGGAGLAETALAHERADPAGLLARHRAGSATHAALCDARVAALIAIGPWGNAQGMWDAAGLAGLRAPLLVMAGTADDISDYDAMRGIWAGANGVDRYLLSFRAAGHNAAAPYPAAEESWAHSEVLGWAPFAHHADPVWDTVRMNNIAQHVAAAFLGLHLQGDRGMAAYLAPDLPGFGPGGAAGLDWEQAAAGAQVSICKRAKT